LGRSPEIKARLHFDNYPLFTEMIAHLHGKLISKHPNQAIVEAGGVGYDVAITIPTFSDLPTVGSEVALHIHTHVREDAIALFGFLRADEKQLFEKLITVGGIGPKLAITILSGMPTVEMVGAIRANDHVRLTRIPGIGKKTAERMCVELRDKLDAFGTQQAAAPVSAVEEDVISALTNLGYQRAMAGKAVERAVGTAGRENFDAIFRAALGMLAK
jgi:Holliday junction DNA helicase RuvA